MSDKDQVYAALDEWSIPYERYCHEAVWHMRDCVENAAPAGAVMCKNYFLTTKSRRVYCLCIARPNARLRTADISKQAGTPRLSFADEAAMAQILRVYPGAVSPMGLIFDAERRVRLLADAALSSCESLAFHPCDNTETVVLSAKDFFQRFVPATGREAELVEVHDFEEGWGDPFF